MRRSATDVLRRGIENVLANWPLLLIRVAEGVLMLAVVIGAVFAVVIPVAVSLGIHGFDEPPRIERIEDVLALAVSKWMTILWVLVAVTGAMLAGLIIHSFVEAGNVAIYVDAERVGQTIPSVQASQGGQTGLSVPHPLRVFTIDKWLAAARRSLWPVFWIYNAAWAVGLAVMLIPLLLVALLVLMFRGSAAALAIGCFGLVLSAMFVVVVTLVTHFWAQKSIVVSVARSIPATDALGEGWRDIRDDFGRHLAVGAVIFAISLGGMMFFSSFSMMFSSDIEWLQFAMMPAQMGLSLLQTAFSAAMGAWLLASLAGLTVDRRA